ncbi:lipopolysaccharide N-acetylglucosaminyltransferase [Pseudocitrobacter cyperus]|uniref:Lipopolysaccharide N-acetylglucosaminyltransferase n=1 Tax=Pseudocitrobacter cyperus TaxID=3112843 RepID=A0ABV0HM01_9ENTR
MIKKIVFTVTPIFSIPPRGAAAVETWIYQVAKRLSISNAIACIKNPDYPDFYKVNETCNIHYIGFSKLYKRIFQKWTRLDPLPYSKRVLNIRDSYANDDESVIVIHNSMKLYRQIRKQRPQAKLVLHMHNAFEPKGIDKNTKMLVPSQFLKTYYQEHIPGIDIKVVPNGFCAETYSVQSTCMLRQQLHINRNDRVLLYAGRVSPDKGILMLLQAFKKLIAEQDNLKLVVVGDPFASRRGEKAEYQKKVLDAAKEVGDHCIMVGGQPPEKMHEYYAVADLVIVPSQVEEAFCMVAAEAMAAERPVLASKKGGISEFVKPGVTGYHLSEPITVESIVTDITYVLADQNREQIARSAKEHVFSHYSWDHVTASFERNIRDWFDKA